jgi:hypothetical protein
MTTAAPSLPPEEAFIRATFATFPDGLALDIAKVLNVLCPDACGGHPETVIAHVDALMEGLYQRRALFCPGHRWLSHHVESIAGHLVFLFEGRYVQWSEAGWSFEEATSIYFLPKVPNPMGALK